MRRVSAKVIPFYLILAVSLLATTATRANKLDLTTARFIDCTDTARCRADNVAYERFMAEYSFGISPKLLSPASTLGYSGFYLGFEGSVATIPSTGTKDFDGTNYKDSRWTIGSGTYGGTPPAMFMPTIHVRKGLPWSMEVGSSISYLAQSELVALGGEVKWAPFEGYRHKFRGAMPDIAVRGTVNRVIGQQDVDMTLIGVDGSLSYPFGIGGMISLEPYAGYQHMWTIIRTEPTIIRTDNGTSATYHDSIAGNYDVSSANLSGPNLSRHNIFFGMAFNFELLLITMDWKFGLPGSWTVKQNNATSTAEEQVKTKVDTQVAFNFGVGLKF